VKDFKRMEISLEQLHKDFNTQLEALGTNTKEFHNTIIDLSAKYPDHKELLQFMVFINDKLETNQTIFAEIVIDSFNESIRNKLTLVQKLIEEKEIKTDTFDNMTIWEKVKSTGYIMKNVKMILTALAVITLAAGAVLAPDMFIEIIKELSKLL